MNTPPTPPEARRITPDCQLVQIFIDTSRCSDGTNKHDWSGWRELPNGGEAVCSECGMGAMHHSLMFGPDFNL